MQQPRLTENFLVRALPLDIAAELERHATIFELQLTQQVFEGEDGANVFFPLDSVISLLRNLADGNSVEVAMVGREGLASVSTVLGVPETVIEGITQGRGFVARVDAAAVRDVMQRSAAARELFYRYFASYLAGATQLAACNRLHVIVKRLAHWLLLLHDRVGTDEMSVTQEFLSRMLGSRRAGINEAVHALEESGAIEHRRNRVRVRDRKLLEAESCECYRTIADEYEHALGFKPVATGRIASID